MQESSRNLNQQGLPHITDDHPFTKIDCYYLLHTSPVSVQVSWVSTPPPDQLTEAAISSHTLRSVLLTVIFMVTCWVLASRARTNTSWPPRNTPARRRVCVFLLWSTWSERSHGCIPRNWEICLTASGGVERGRSSLELPQIPIWNMPQKYSKHNLQEYPKYTRDIQRYTNIISKNTQSIQGVSKGILTYMDSI